MWDTVSWKMSSCYRNSRASMIACPKLLFAIPFISEQDKKTLGLVGQLHTSCIRSQVASGRRFSTNPSCQQVPGCWWSLKHCMQLRQLVVCIGSSITEVPCAPGELSAETLLLKSKSQDWDGTFFSLSKHKSMISSAWLTCLVCTG